MINGAKQIQKVVVVGGRSDLAISTLKYLPLVASPEIILIVKNLKPQANIEGLGNVRLVEGDLLQVFQLNHLISEIAKESDVDLFILAAGYLGMKPSESTQVDFENIIDVNFSSSSKVLKQMVAILKNQMHGRILVFSSAAALRPRSANYAYGATKAGLDFLARGFQLDLERNAGSITVVRPGFVFTKMTEGLKPAPFAITSDVLGRIAAGAVMANKKVTYAPRVLKYLMLIVKLLPNRILKKLG